MLTILCEKPDQGRAYGAAFDHVDRNKYIEVKPCSIFPGGAIIVWAIGHLCKLQPPELYKEEWKEWKLSTLPMIPETFQHQVVKEKAAHFKIVKEKLQQATEIIIATDPADEGELIARLIIQMSGASKKPLKRFWCSSMTKTAILEGFQNLRDAKETENNYHAAKARSYSDWLIGLNTSRAYSILFREKFGLHETFSSGRVQTPVLCLIHNREEEIKNFKSKPFYQVIGEFNANGLKYVGALIYEGDFKLLNYEQAKAWSEECKGLQQATINSVISEEKQSNPPKLHSLSSLQAKLNRKYKISPEDVLKIAQGLYEKKFISYPRTSSQYLTESEAKSLPGVLASLEGLEPYSELVRNIARNSIGGDKKYVNDTKVEDHFALIPTNVVPNLLDLTAQEKQLYDEIVRSIIAVHYGPNIFTETTILTNVQSHVFVSQGKQVLDDGWKVLWKGQKSEDDDKEKDIQKLPVVQKGQQIGIENIELGKGQTKPPKVYTEGQLITLMKTAGKYVEDEDLDTNFGGVGTEATRAGIIKTLKDRSYILVRDNKVSVTEKGKMLVKAVSGTALSSVEMTAKWEMFLEKIRKGGNQAPGLSQAFIEKAKAFASSLVEKAINECDTWNVEQLAVGVKDKASEAVGKCPLCGKNVVEKQSIYGCMGYKKDDRNSCNFTLPKTFLSKSISASNATKLLEGKKTTLIKGLKGNKEGAKPFDAHLILKAGKIEFEFAKKKTSGTKARKSFSGSKKKRVRA